MSATVATISTGVTPGLIGRITELHGQGFGRQLMDEALALCRLNKFESVYLWTFSGLGAARRLYDDAGFQITYEKPGLGWGTDVTEQKLVLVL
jgi:ribosomal protein S18 acetylase RimI-like enzyme